MSCATRRKMAEHEVDSRMQQRAAVLIVDDEPDMVNGLRRLLSLDRYQVETAESIAELMDRRDWSHFVAILLDRKLPDGYAEDILPELKGLAPDASVIIMTGHSDLESTIASFRAGAADYLLKPVDPDTLRDRLRRVHQLHSTRKALQREQGERKRAEKALRDSEERLRAVLNTAADAIITIDRHGIIASINAATEQMFGYSRDELVGQNVKVLMPEPYCTDHDSYITRYLKSGEARIIGIGREVVGRHKDGSTTFPISLAVSKVGHLGLFTGIIRDISEQRRLQREVVAIAEEEQRRIAQDLHDSTQQELAGLGMLAQTLVDKLAIECRDLPQASVEACTKLAKKIAGGIARAHHEVQAISRGLVPIQLGGEGLMDALRELASRTDDIDGITCAFKCEQPIEVADSLTATHLYRIAQEAVANALKHARPEHILIALECDHGRPVLLVADDGIGFDPTQQTDGMGLKTMHYRASLIGANVAIHPVEAGGTLVTCKLFERGRC